MFTITSTLFKYGESKHPELVIYENQEQLDEAFEQYKDDIEQHEAYLALIEEPYSKWVIHVLTSDGKECKGAIDL